MPLLPTSRTANSSRRVARVTDRPMKSATRRPASPAMPISSSITFLSERPSMAKEITPTEASAVTTVTTAISVT